MLGILLLSSGHPVSLKLDLPFSLQLQKATYSCKGIYHYWKAKVDTYLPCLACCNSGILAFSVHAYLTPVDVEIINRFLFLNLNCGVYLFYQLHMLMLTVFLKL